MDSADETWPSLRTWAAFLISAVAASTISSWLQRTTRLPLITGYIIGGILCGPHAVGIVSNAECMQLAKLITDDAMGFIGFSAGAKFLLSELTGSLKPILSLLVSLVLITYVLVFGGMLCASPWLEVSAGEPPSSVMAIALIMACLAVARSPSSAIAVVSELGAHGAFTTAALSLTVLTDVVVVLLFALTLLLVHALSEESGKEKPSIGLVLGVFLLQMAISAVVGVLLGFLLHGFISCTSSGVTTATKSHENSHRTSLGELPEGTPETERRAEEAERERKGAPAPVPRAAAPPAAAAGKSRPQLRRFNSVIAASSHGGSASAAAAVALHEASSAASGALFSTPRAAYRRRAALIAALWLGAKLALFGGEFFFLQACGFEVFEAEAAEERQFGTPLHQPLVITMVAGLVVVNFTPSRRSFLRILHDSSEPVYVAFFALTGMTLQLDALLPNLPAAVLIFLLRLGGIVAGSYCGGVAGGSLPEHYTRLWMALITQAGVALGLAQKVSHEFANSFGPSLALCVTAEIVITQLAGPVLMKAAIIAVGEAHGTYAPGDGPAPLGAAPQARPKPRNAVLVAASPDAEAAALHERLSERGWELATCDAAFTFAALLSSPSSSSLHPDAVDAAAGFGSGPGPGGAAAQQRRTARLNQLARHLNRHSADRALLALLRRLSAAGAEPSPPTPSDRPSGRRVTWGAGAAAATPLLAAPDEAAAADVETAALRDTGALTELSLLLAIASLDSLDVLVLMLPSDAEALRVARLLQSSAALLPLIHERQTATPQILVRVATASAADALAREPLPAFAVTPVVSGRVALPNLMAEVLHPLCHWSHELDNSLDEDEE